MMAQPSFPPFSSSPSSPHHRHQSSLETVIDFTTEPPLSPHARQQAARKFHRIVDHFDNAVNLGAAAGVGVGSGYRRARLVRLTYDYALSPVSQDNFLRAFFRALELSMDNGEDDGNDNENDNGEDDGNDNENDNGEDDGNDNENDNENDNGIDTALDDQLQSKVFGFADYLFDNFFLPSRPDKSPFRSPIPVRDTDTSKSSQSIYPEDSPTVSRFSFCYSKTARRRRVRGNT